MALAPFEEVGNFPSWGALVPALAAAHPDVVTLILQKLRFVFT